MGVDYMSYYIIIMLLPFTNVAFIRTGYRIHYIVTKVWILNVLKSDQCLKTVG